MKIDKDKTIAAISTPIGEGGIGIVRVSGENTLNIVRKLFSSKDKYIFEPRRAVLGKIIAANGEIIDKGIGIYYKKPNSYTGEDVFEFQVHGGVMILNKILDELIESGCRLAEPGEFTKQAFLNGKIDLVEAEAVIDIIEAKSKRAAINAEKILEGDFSEKLSEIRSSLKEILISLESAIDFPEEDIEFETFPGIKEKIVRISNMVEKILHSYEKGKFYREGINLTIAGIPNVGKSKLLNKLLGRERAIVSEKAGTTRDFIEELTEIKGIPVKVVDTAGIRESKDPIEQEGVKLTKKKIGEADIIIFVIDPLMGVSNEEIEAFNGIDEKKRIIVLNKSDIADEKQINSAVKYLSGDFVILSAKTGHGIETLIDFIYRKINEEAADDFEGLFISTQRQKRIVSETLNNVQNALSEINKNSPAEFVALFVRSAIEKIGYLTGEFYNEEILNDIFDRFCIGK